MTQLAVIIIEFIFSAAALFCISICLYVCFQSSSFHSYFRALLLMILSILFVYETLVILIPFNAVFPELASSLNLHQIRRVGQVVTFITLTIAFLVISVERTIAVSCCSKYESFTSSWPVVALLVATTVFSIAFKKIADYCRFILPCGPHKLVLDDARGLVLVLCLFCDVATVLTLLFSWWRNGSLRSANSCRERNLATKYQLSENERISHLLFPLTASMMVAKVFVFSFITSYRFYRTHPSADLFFSACRLTISIYSMSCLAWLYHLHKPYQLSIQKVFGSCGLLSLEREQSVDQHQTNETPHETYFVMLEEQWNASAPQSKTTQQETE